jgi:hypothetical protein
LPFQGNVFIQERHAAVIGCGAVWPFIRVSCQDKERNIDNINRRIDPSAKNRANNLPIDDNIIRCSWGKLQQRKELFAIYYAKQYIMEKVSRKCQRRKNILGSILW